LTGFRDLQINNFGSSMIYTDITLGSQREAVRTEAIALSDGFRKPVQIDEEPQFLSRFAVFHPKI
jgi:hypothetical protein